MSYLLHWEGQSESRGLTIRSSRNRLVAPELSWGFKGGFGLTQVLEPMIRFRQLLSIPLLAMWTVSYASHAIELEWNNLSFETSSGYRVAIASNGERTVSLHIWYKRTPVQIPRSDYRQITTPTLNNVHLSEGRNGQADLEIPSYTSGGSSDHTGRKRTWILSMKHEKYVGVSSREEPVDSRSGL
jgi:hypothetical protein